MRRERVHYLLKEGKVTFKREKRIDTPLKGVSHVAPPFWRKCVSHQQVLQGHLARGEEVTWKAKSGGIFLWPKIICIELTWSNNDLW